MMPILTTSPEMPCADRGAFVSSKPIMPSAVIVEVLMLSSCSCVSPGPTSTASCRLDSVMLVRRTLALRDQQRVERNGPLAFDPQQQRVDVDLCDRAGMRGGKARQCDDGASCGVEVGARPAARTVE